ncbi:MULTISPECIES: hypothetical protein [Bacillus cereus group]|nr:hypothetical protein [Bacillus thuringiensis]EEM74442.1 hypothetical protein bthur0010_55440 [Bacillus thuringiensis serovar pondicheriensis BGSC 4BA1]
MATVNTIVNVLMTMSVRAVEININVAKENTSAVKEDVKNLTVNVL